MRFIRCSLPQLGGILFLPYHKGLIVLGLIGTKRLLLLLCTLLLFCVGVTHTCLACVLDQVEALYLLLGIPNVHADLLGGGGGGGGGGCSGDVGASALLSCIA